jgi:hypothetical protein
MRMDEYVNVQGFAAGSQSPPLRTDFARGAWSDHRIMSHEAVRCRYCPALQWPSNAQDPVHHCPECDLSEAHHSLGDLAKIRAYLSEVPA